MMNPYYQSAVRRTAFEAEAKSWLGTPFKQGERAVKGPHGGVDCIGLCIAIHVACGACEPVECERLPLDWHLHHDSSAIVDFLRRPKMLQRLRSIPADEPLISGDLVAVQTGLCVHHLGLYIADEVGRHLLHVPIGACVQRWPLDFAPLVGKVRSVWRVMEVSQ